MWRVEYYTDRGGAEPVAEWLDNLEKNVRANILDKVARLREHGLLLLNTNMMKPIKGYEAGFYELRYGGYRVVIYNNAHRDKFVLLHGFKKQRQRERHEIETAHSRLREYLQREVI